MSEPQVVRCAGGSGGDGDGGAREDADEGGGDDRIMIASMHGRCATRSPVGKQGVRAHGHMARTHRSRGLAGEAQRTLGKAYGASVRYAHRMRLDVLDALER